MQNNQKENLRQIQKKISRETIKLYKLRDKKLEEYKHKINQLFERKIRIKMECNKNR